MKKTGDPRRTLTAIAKVSNAGAARTNPTAERTMSTERLRWFRYICIRGERGVEGRYFFTWLSSPRGRTLLVPPRLYRGRKIRARGAFRRPRALAANTAPESTY